jgi:hypothetical protein
MLIVYIIDDRAKAVPMGKSNHILAASNDDSSDYEDDDYDSEEDEPPPARGGAGPAGTIRKLEVPGPARMELSVIKKQMTERQKIDIPDNMCTFYLGPGTHGSSMHSADV